MLPEEYDGEPVTAIGAAAFSGEDLTSIYIPLTVTAIGKNAFKGCEIYDVYYEGTEEQWGEISIAAGNTPLTDANIHYGSYGPEPATSYTITFKDYDGTVLKVEKVNAGGSATPPESPGREGHVFIRWQGSFTNVQADTAIIAQYEATTSPVIVVSSTSAKAGDSVDVEICLRNNPGIATAILKANYDSSVLTLNSFEYGSLFQSGGEAPQNLNSPVTLAWSSSEGNISGDVTYAVLHFTAAADTQAGSTTSVEVSYADSDIINLDENDVEFQIISGTVLIQ